MADESTGDRPILRTAVCDVLGIEYPILQSGMGGVAGPELAAEVSNAGGLGILAGTLTPPDALRDMIRELRGRTDRPFGVNLLMLDELRPPTSTDELTEASIAAVHTVLNPIREQLGLEPTTERPPTAPDWLGESIEVIIREHVPVFSAGLGDPGRVLNGQLHEAGIKTVVMVTSAADARDVAANGADVIVAQGLEAGGHRSHFGKPHHGPHHDLGTLTLVPEVVDAVDVPVVAAGGILDGRGLAAALMLGASGVLMGSRFLACRESMAPDAHKKRLLEDGGERTIVTDQLSGRYARALRNALTDTLSGDGRPPAAALPFPSQFLVNSDIFAHAMQHDDADHMPLWAGQSVGRIEDLPWAADVVHATIRQARALLTGALADDVALDDATA